ncbi:hypothetical protein [Burkholderia pseudomallei]|uniref:hypothetical protein n=1 Tax=Burkholderia pseudomallei TaxID=28450 RepID=UPI0015C35F64|nr:hypothetical protein [Burkholderia pseudomallei]MCQ8215728.1 hypothetical protein [Burkholderia pseudomallei]
MKFFWHGRARSRNDRPSVASKAQAGKQREAALAAEAVPRLTIRRSNGFLRIVANRQEKVAVGRLAANLARYL